MPPDQLIPQHPEGRGHVERLLDTHHGQFQAQVGQGHQYFRQAHHLVAHHEARREPDGRLPEIHQIGGLLQGLG